MSLKHHISPNAFSDENYNSVFIEYYSQLCNYCYYLINDYEAAEDIVQDLFVNVWENWDRLKSIDSIKGYLFRSTKNRSINYIKQQLKVSYSQSFESNLDFVSDSKLPSASEMLESSELESIIEKAIDNLPAKCRTIFILKRINGMSNQEIAEQLNISVKTVEAQTTIALKRMYSFLSDHWELCLTFYILNKVFLPSA